MYFTAKRLIVAISVTLTLVSTVAVAQEGGRGGKGMMDMPRYDPTTEVTLSGIVEKIEIVNAGECPGCEGGTHLWLDLVGTSYEVHLGPTHFLETNDWSFHDGEALEVTGSRVELDDSVTILAREVRRGEKTLVLRDELGRPLWRRGRR